MSKARASPGFVVFGHPPGGAALSRAIWRVGSGSPGEALLPTPGMSAVPHAKKKPVHAYELFLKYGGEGGLTRFARRYSAHPWASPLRGQRRRCSKTLPAFLSGQPAYCVRGLSNWRCQLSNPGRGFSSPPAENIKEKSPYLRTGSHLEYGGEGGIDSLRSPLRGSPLTACAVCPTGVASCRTPVGGSHPPRRRI